MLFHPSFSPPLINEDLLAGPQLVFTLNNRFFRHQACYSLLPAKPGGQADRVISLCRWSQPMSTAEHMEPNSIFNLLCTHIYPVLTVSFTLFSVHDSQIMHGQYWNTHVGENKKDIFYIFLWFSLQLLNKKQKNPLKIIVSVLSITVIMCVYCL